MITLSGDPLQTPAEISEAPRILVVDDEQVIRDILSEFLSMEGYVVRSVNSGERALTDSGCGPTTW